MPQDRSVNETAAVDGKKTYLNTFQDSSDTSDCFPITYDVGKHPELLSYQPALKNRTSYKNTSNTSTSCGRLPDDYLQCTHAEPESMSTLWFLADDSHTSVIDLNRFLVQADSHTHPAAHDLGHKPTVPVKTAAGDPKPDEGLQDSNQDEPGMKLLTREVGLGKSPDLRSKLSQHSGSDNSNYGRISNYIPRPNSGQSNEDLEMTPLDPPESTSGDSGYVGRNVSSSTCPRSNSLSSSES